MMKLVQTVALAALAMAATPLVAQTTLNAGISGTLTTSVPTPVPGVQQFTLNGGFTSYTASSDLPQINGNDLNQYSFSVTGTSQSYDADNRRVVYGNVTGTINGYGQVVQTLAPTQLIVTFSEDFSTASILGSLQSTGPATPAGFPGPVDFSAANGAAITGTYTSFGVSGGGGSVVGNITFPFAAAVPEPATWGLMILGFGMAGTALRRRARPLALAA